MEYYIGKRQSIELNIQKTDHNLLKKWVLEKFQNHKEFEWVVKNSNDWRLRPNDCFQTKYEIKSINQQREPSWFIFKKK